MESIKDRINLESLPEKELHKRLHVYFSSNFQVFSEITSNCKKRRIDILMYHNSDIDMSYPIGIEIKKTNIKRGGHIAEWCIQASDYTRLEFNNQKALIFITPQISGWYLDEGERVSQHNVEKPFTAGSHNNVNSYLYKSHGFGELQKYYDYNKKGAFRLVVNTWIIWDSFNPSFFNMENYLKCK